MSSERRTAVNRTNSRHSTGPRTPEGKARSSMNSSLLGGTGTCYLYAGAFAEAQEALPPASVPPAAKPFHAPLRIETCFLFLSLLKGEGYVF